MTFDGGMLNLKHFLDKYYSLISKSFIGKQTIAIFLCVRISCETN